MIVIVRDQSVSIEGANYATVLYRILGYPAQRHCRAHSILSIHRNALIYKRKSFLPTVEIRLSVRQIFSLMISKEKLRDSNFARCRQLSPTIGRFFAPSTMQGNMRRCEKRPSLFIARDVRARHAQRLPLPDLLADRVT